jgi:hypothetical protein
MLQNTKRGTGITDDDDDNNNNKCLLRREVGY